jgi:glycosyltransferase involved in cell wall biosynthesis
VYTTGRRARAEAYEHKAAALCVDEPHFESVFSGHCKLIGPRPDHPVGQRSVLNSLPSMDISMTSSPTPAGPTLTVVVPCFNERATILELLRRVLAVQLASEVLVVDDGSTDGTRELIAEQLPNLPGVRLLAQEKNQGKGAALRRGFREATGDIVIVQDADLEYDPREISKVIAPILEGDADVVYGSRFQGGPHRVLYFWHSIGNRLLTTVSNIVTDLNLTDMETCYKAFRREIIQSIELQEDRFGFEPEITVKLARKKGIRIYEVPISYRGRTYDEGKKIGIKDAVRAMYCLAKFGIRR